MTKRKPLARALSLALAGALGAGTFAISGSVLAQDNTADAPLEEIITTGSRIVRRELTDSQPVQVLDSAAIEATGLNNIGDILMNITASDGTGLRPITTATNGSDGTQQISLRNLGADRTLILVDGRRWVTDIDQTVDLNTIPLAMIERIEILKDGASAIYGSDAIAGVINVITKSDFDGVTADLYYGETAKGDGTQETIALTMGTSDDVSSTVISVSYTSQEEIMAGDREISSVPYLGCYQPGVDSFLCGSSYPENGRIFDTNLTKIPGAPGTSPDDFEPWSNAARYNFAPINYLQQPIERYNIFAKMTRELSESVELYGKLTYVKRTSVQQLAEVPMGLGVSNFGPQWNWRPGANITADNVFNPFGEDIAAMGLRAIAVGPRQPNYDYDTYGLNLGLRGDFEAGGRMFNWEIGGQRNDGQYDSINHNYINLFNMARATGPSFRDADNILRCGTPGNVIAGCVPYNFFGGPDLGLSNGVISQEEFDAMNDYVSYTQVNGGGNSTENYYADLSGEMFDLPGGKAAFAVGFEYRADKAFNRPDSLVAEGGSSDNYSEPTRGKTKAKEMYLEVSLPLLADVAFAQDLELNAAVRNTDYEGYGFVNNVGIPAEVESATTSRLGLLWRPFEDLMIRANWGETFRAPSAFDLYGGRSESFPTAQDPCNTTNFPDQDTATQNRCLADGVPVGGWDQPTSQLRTLVGGNPGLRSEEGENFTVGFVYSPSFVENLDIIVDYWRVELDEAQATRGVSTVLNLCYREGDAGMCALVDRDPADGALNAVDVRRFNLAGRDVAGVDFGLRYALSTDSLGDFRFGWDTTYTQHDKTRSTPDADWNDTVGQYQGETNWEYRTVVTTDWSYGDWGAQWTMRYVSELEEDCWVHAFGIGDIDPDSPTYNPINCSNPTEENLFGDIGKNVMDATLYHDLRVTYMFPWEAVVSVGARNLFGEEPPTTQNSFSHSFDGAYDLPGGAYWYASYRHNF